MAVDVEVLRAAFRAFGRPIHARLVMRVRGLVDAVVGSGRPIAGQRLDDLEGSMARAWQVTQAVEQQLETISSELQPPTGPFVVDMTMAGVLRRHPGAQGVLASLGLPGCGGCAVRHDETLGEAIDGYGFNGAEVLQSLNALLDETPSGAPAQHG